MPITVKKYLAAAFFTIYALYGNVTAQPISRIGNSPYPYTATPDTLFMVSFSHMSSTQQFTVVTLQGLVAKVKPQIMLELGASGFRSDLPNYGVTYDSTYYNDFRGLITHFKSRISGYILCGIQDTTTDPAISVCGMLNAIAVNAPDTALLDSLGVAQIYSTIGKGEIWSIDTLNNSYSKKIISVQDPAKCIYLSDYSIFSGALHFWDWPTNPVPLSIFSTMDINGACFGWSDEHDLVTATSENALHVHASDFSSNLSVYTNFNIPAQHQINPTSDTILQPGVHTVCFVMTDGDNVQWDGGDFLAVSNWYGNPHRGQVNLGWTMSPALAELGPTLLKHMYDSAATTPTGRDAFIAAPSGMGYSYPDLFSQPDSGAAITSRMMQKADMSILNVISNNYTVASIAPYLYEPNIEAVFYYTYQNDYFGLHGFTDCINDKPVISGRFNLNSNDFSTYTLADSINAQAKDPYSPNGYSLVPVNVWSSTVDSVIQLVHMLDSNVRVVTPQSFVKLFMAGNNCIAANLGINKVSTANGVTVYNDPNPCTDHMDIVYTLPDDSRVDATLYDQYGKVVKELFSESSTAGTHTTTVDTRQLSAGMYYYTLRGDYFAITRKCLVLR